MINRDGGASTWRGAPFACALIVFVALLGFGLSVAVVAPTAQAQGADFGITHETTGDTVVVRIDRVSTPIGALEIELRGVPPLAEECAVLSGMGACAQNGDVVRIVAINPTGWDAPDLLSEVRFETEPGDFEFVLIRGTDVEGVDLDGDARPVGDDDAGDGDGGFPTGLLVIAALVVVVGLAAAMVARSRAAQSDVHPE